MPDEQPGAENAGGNVAARRTVCCTQVRFKSNLASMLAVLLLVQTPHTVLLVLKGTSGFLVH